MRGYTVIWWPPAQRDLADLWIASPRRQAVADAANAIERQLADSPTDAGTSGREGLRRLAISPLAVQFTIDEGDRKVTVWSVVIAD